MLGLMMYSGTGFGLHANAQGLSIQERILMPGPLITGHEDYESDCESCHSAFEEQEMSVLCQDCHEEIAFDRNSATGFHGQSPLASTDSCESCHTDHEGRDVDITGLVSENFNHDFTRFELLGAHEPLDCATCHDADIVYRDAPSDCSGCHQDQDLHDGALGDDCAECHQSDAWNQQLDFNHDDTDFPLVGLHTDLACSTCHLNQQYEFPSTDCVSCHELSNVHGNAYGNDCTSCHSPEGWDDNTFNHDETDFPLQGAHQDVPCTSCHDDDQLLDDAVILLPFTQQFLPFSQIGNNSLTDSVTSNSAGAGNTSRTCIDCHAADDLHFGRNGEDCASCHNNELWSDILFAHDTDTDYPLTGEHADVECYQCHTGSLTAELPQDCEACHQGDDVHNSPDMENCTSCHETSGWLTVQSFDHEFSAFPLLGMHRIAPCESCHLDAEFSDIEADCVSCHEDDDLHENTLGSACNDCHTPNAWELWQFDHGGQTDYNLEGSHADLTCVSCHLPGTTADAVASDCVSCHTQDDSHGGQFGTQCEQCHNMTDFSEVTITGRFR